MDLKVGLVCKLTGEIAAFEGYKFSFRQFTKKDLYELDSKK